MNSIDPHIDTIVCQSAPPDMSGEDRRFWDVILPDPVDQARRVTLCRCRTEKAVLAVVEAIIRRDTGGPLNVIIETRYQ